MQEIWRENGPPAYMSLASYIGWKPPTGTGKTEQGGQYGDLAELEGMFEGGVIQ